MIPTQIQSNIVRINQSAVYAFYIVKSSALYPLALVCDDSDTLVGVIGHTELNPRENDVQNKNCGQICNRNFMYLNNDDDDATYTKARNIFAENQQIHVLPIIDKNSEPVKIFGRFQAFFLEKYRSCPYFYYAHSLLRAARMAKSKGYDKISTIEFGVAGGGGLVLLELYAREISRITGVCIDVYGFDLGTGLPKSIDHRDLPEIFIHGEYKMDFNLLQNKLYSAKLIIGDICQTTKTFLMNFSPAPIGFISVDVDLYTPTVAILDMLTGDDKYFLPEIIMYFDDIFDSTEFQGEALAIKEFNKKNEIIKISPEDKNFNDEFMFYPKEQWAYYARLKYCKRFNHPKFETNRKNSNNLLIL